jgi:hypothetical protein
VDVLGTISNMVKMTKGEDMPKQAFAGKLKKGEIYHTNGITSWPSNGRTSVMSYSIPLPMMLYILRHPHQKGHIMKYNQLQCRSTSVVWRDHTRCCRIIHLREGNKPVEETFPSSVGRVSGQCTYLA